MTQQSWKSLAKKGLRILPDHGRSAIDLYRKATLVKRRSAAKIRVFLSQNSLPDPDTVYWVNPDRIVYYTNYSKGGDSREPKNRVFHRIKDKGSVRSGDWDISDYKFTNLEVYKALDQRINHSTDWQDTAFFRETLTRIESGDFRWNCHNRADLEERCSYLDSLIHSIRKDGYKRNSEIFLPGDELQGLTKHHKIGHEITCNIGRDGSYLFQDGRHRLAIAKILGIKSVAVKVLVRHREWQQLRELLLSMAKVGGGASQKGLLYQPVLHPDLQDIPAAHDCEDRFAAIQHHLSRKPGNLLDIGANLAYFCHKFENLGYSCYAIELLRDVAWAAKKIRDAERKEFTILVGDLFDVLNQRIPKDMQFDVVLALNIFHHFIKTDDGHRKLEQMLKTLPIEVMFFEPHRYDEPQMRGAYANYKEEEFVDFLLRHSTLNHADFIFQDRDGRKVYKLCR